MGEVETSEPIVAVSNKALVLDLVEWVAKEPRPYADAMEIWRTSCPRFPIWEDAVDLGFIAHANERGCGAIVRITPAGRAFLRAERRI